MNNLALRTVKSETDHVAPWQLDAILSAAKAKLDQADPKPFVVGRLCQRCKTAPTHSAHHLSIYCEPCRAENLRDAIRRMNAKVAATKSHPCSYCSFPLQGRRKVCANCRHKMRAARRGE